MAPVGPQRQVCMELCSDGFDLSRTLYTPTYGHILPLMQSAREEILSPLIEPDWMHVNHRRVLWWKGLTGYDFE